MPALGNFEDFALALGQVEARLPEEIHRSLSEIGEVVETIAKQKIGEYQAAASSPQGTGWGAWPQLAEATQADRVAQGYTPNDPLKRSGEAQQSIEYRVDGETVAVGSDDPNLLYAELGTVTEPPRPSVGPAMGESMGRNLETIADGIGRAFGGR